MLADHPSVRHIPQLRQLWKTAFGDTDAFLDSFFRTAFSCDRCRCVLDGNAVAAVLYWFDCTIGDEKTAYIYAVATHPDFRNRGLCRMLMADTHALLKARGYASALLVPQKESLRAMYAGMGYRNCGGLEVRECTAADTPAALRAIGAEEFAALRRQFLPEQGVVQECENLAFLAEQLQFYTGDGFLLAAYAEDRTLHGVELLGCCTNLPGIVKALDCDRGSFRRPGSAIPFAMFRPVTDSAITPSYFGFAFD